MHFGMFPERKCDLSSSTPVFNCYSNKVNVRAYKWQIWSSVDILVKEQKGNNREHHTHIQTQKEIGIKERMRDRYKHKIEKKTETKKCLMTKQETETPDKKTIGKSLTGNTK